MHIGRSIFVVVAICIASLAQQWCCCALGPTMDFCLSRSDGVSPSECCPHSAPSSRDHHHDDDSHHGPHPGHHDCECHETRLFVSAKAETRLDSVERVTFGSLPLHLPSFMAKATADHASALAQRLAKGGVWGSSPGGRAGPPLTPLGQRVLLTV